MPPSPPLVILLLAVLLLAAGDAMENPSCNSVELGSGTKDSIFIKKQVVPSGVINIPDYCSRSGKGVSSNRIIVCSRGGSAPYVTMPGDKKCTVIVTCPEDEGGCPVVALTIIQSCYPLTDSHGERLIGSSLN